MDRGTDRVTGSSLQIGYGMIGENYGQVSFVFVLAELARERERERERERGREGGRHADGRLCLVAIDEAHLIYDWQDF